MLVWESIQQKPKIYRQRLFIKQQKVNSLCVRGTNNKIFCSEVLTFTKNFSSDICFDKIRWWIHHPGLPGWNCNPPSWNGITLRLHVEVTFRPGKAGQFSTHYLIRFACIFFECFFINMSFYKTEDSQVVITWSRLAGMKFCPALPESRQCYKLFINHIL